MKANGIFSIATAALLAAVPLGSGASTSCAADAMLVFDGSGSMSETGFNGLTVPRIAKARRAVTRAMPNIAPFRRVGMIVYGPNGTPGDGPGPTAAQTIGCRSIDLRFAPEPDAAARIIGEVTALEPGGSTPLTAAVERAADVLNHRSQPGVVVLVTDGKETCGGAPCELATQLSEQSADLTVHVIGFQVRPDYFDWESGEGALHEPTLTIARCLADITGGTYTSAETVDTLSAALMQTLGCPVIGRLQNPPFG